MVGSWDQPPTLYIELGRPGFLTQLERGLQNQQGPSMPRRIDLGVGQPLPPRASERQATVLATAKELANSHSRSHGRLQEQLCQGRRLPPPEDAEIEDDEESSKQELSSYRIPDPEPAPATHMGLDSPDPNGLGAAWSSLGGQQVMQVVPVPLVNTMLEVHRELITEVRQHSDARVAAAEAQAKTAQVEAEKAKLWI